MKFKVGDKVVGYKVFGSRTASITGVYTITKIKSLDNIHFAWLINEKGETASGFEFQLLPMTGMIKDLYDV